MGILDKILSQPIEKLVLSNKKPPNKEALRLYREILKFAATFNWHTGDGNKWSEMIAKSARKEFELAREEQDPVLLMKMMLTSRESIQKTKEKMNATFFSVNQTLANKERHIKYENETGIKDFNLRK